MRILTTLLLIAGCAKVSGQVQVAVPGNRVITLAGQPAGTRSANNARSAPGDSPIPVNIQLVPGQALQFQVSGAVDAVGPDGRLNCNDSVVAEFSITRIVAPCRALLGVFLADTTRPQPGAGIDFTGDARDHPVLRPLLQQPFLIGSGVSPTSDRKAFVIPAGATRLFLSPLGNPNSTGEFRVTVRASAPPPVPSNPVRVSAVSVISLAGQADGTLSANNARIAPVHSPAIASVPLVAGQVLRIVAAGSAEGEGPDGRPNCSDSFTAEFSIARVDTRCRAVVGLFMGDSLRPQPPALNFTGATRNTVRVEPLLQQPFLIGSGYTDSGELKQFVVPAGATRLYFASMGSPPTAGSFIVTVSPVAESTPVLQRSGVLRAAGFSAGGPSPGSIAAIFGASLADSTRSASEVPLPARLDRTQVYFNLRPAPLFFASPGQINAQVPWELAGESSAQLVVVRNGAASMPVPVDLRASGPGIFLVREGAGVIVNGATGQLVDQQSGVRQGDVLVIYASGLGPVEGPVVTGGPASVTDLEPVRQPVAALLRSGGSDIPLQVLFAGSAPGFIGVNQVNAVVPAGVPAGVTSLRLRTGDAESNEVRIAVVE